MKRDARLKKTTIGRDFRCNHSKRSHDPMGCLKKSPAMIWKFCPKIGHKSKMVSNAGGRKSLKLDGGAEGDRTPDLRTAKRTTAKT
jgi:hypothetical protein